jgi:thiol-disulfide isomerase/thioredoxin
MHRLRFASSGAVALALAATLSCQRSTAPKPTPPAGYIAFGPIAPFRLDPPVFTDADVSGLLGTLETLLARETDPPKWQWQSTEFQPHGSMHFWEFQSRLERGRMTDAQFANVAAHFDRLATSRPADRAYIEHRKWVALNIGVGRIAPEIVGKDLTGVEFKLSDSRGKVTMLVFSGEWCGPCRSEYPYERLMLELYRDKPFAIVGVSSDASVETAKQGKIDARLPFRSWWDGFEKVRTSGPIATTWGIVGWPTSYVMDATGTIRFAGVDHEDALKAVAQLMEELPRAR